MSWTSLSWTSLDFSGLLLDFCWTSGLLLDFSCARVLRLPVIGTLGLVLRAKARGRIPVARPVVEDLRRAGLYLSDALIREALALVAE